MEAAVIEKRTKCGGVVNYVSIEFLMKHRLEVTAASREDLYCRMSNIMDDNFDIIVAMRVHNERKYFVPIYQIRADCNKKSTKKRQKNEKTSRIAAQYSWDNKGNQKQD